MNYIEELTSVLREAAEVIKDRRKVGDKPQASLLGRAPRFLYRALHKGDDAETIKEIRGKVERSIQSFHVRYF